MSLGLVLILTLVILFAMMIGVAYLSRFIVGRTIGRKHLVLDYIAENHEVPDEWKIQYSERVGEARQKHGFGPQSRAVQAREAGRILRRLDRLLRYVDETRLIADEGTRLGLTSTLEALCERWEKKANE